MPPDDTRITRLENLRRQLERLRRRLDESQESFEGLTDKIKSLNEDFAIASLGENRYAVRQQIKAAEKQRAYVETEIDRLEREKVKTEKEIRPLERSVNSKKLHDALLSLGYDEQQRIYQPAINKKPFGAFWIPGPHEHGKAWLVNRFLKKRYKDSYEDIYYPEGNIRRIEFPCATFADLTSAVLWDIVASKLKKPATHTGQQLADLLFEMSQRGPVVLIFRQVEAAEAQLVRDEVIENFWRLLAARAGDGDWEGETGLLMFMTFEEDADVGGWDLPFADPADSHVDRALPIPLPSLQPFTRDDLDKWIDATQADLYKYDLISRREEHIADILSASEGGIPMRAIKRICEICDCGWDGEWIR